MLQRTLPAGFIAPCLPTKTASLPSGSQWVHEIKHDGFRIIARKNGSQVRLYSRPGNDLTYRFPLIVDALAPGHTNNRRQSPDSACVSWTKEAKLCPISRKAGRSLSNMRAVRLT
jgi:hypothetical protein